MKTINTKLEIASELFELGRIKTSIEIDSAIAPAKIHTLLERHARGDWGQLSSDDGARNDRAIKDGRFILSIYNLGDEGAVEIVTEEDRSYTTIDFSTLS